VRLPAIAGESGAIFMRGGRLAALRTEPEVRQLAEPSTIVVDGEGGLALPGFHDAHLHLLSYARSLSTLDCSGLTSIASIRSALARKARELPAGAWLQATHYDDACLAERRHPNRRDLDAVSTRHRIRLRHRGLHLDVLNTAALQALQLADAPASMAERDGESGELTGRLFRADDWLLYAQDTPNLHGSRGFARGLIFKRDGTLVASVAQEGLVRMRRAER